MAIDLSIDDLRLEIDRLDGEIVKAIQARTDASRTIGKIRKQQGGGKIDPAREQIIYGRYAELGEEGKAIADNLLQLGRGKIDMVK